MTKLSDLRKQLRTGELLSKLSEGDGAPAALRQYTLNAAATDALIKFGKHNGLLLTNIVKKDPGYMNWILENDFPSELKDVVRVVLAGRDADEMKGAAAELEAAFKKPREKPTWTAAEAERLIKFAEGLPKHATRKR